MIGSYWHDRDVLGHSAANTQSFAHCKKAQYTSKGVESKKVEQRSCKNVREESRSFDNLKNILPEPISKYNHIAKDMLWSFSR